MRIEIPEFSRCLICVPLRYGILTFGYLNLAFTTFLISLELWLIIEYEADSTVLESLQSAGLFMYRGVALFSQFWLIILLYFLEVIFNVILLVGAHMKRPKLIRVYYYYGITTALAAFFSYLLVRQPSTYVRSLDFHLIEFCVAFSGLVLHVYLLLLIRSEFRKLDDKNRVSFVNNVAEVYLNPHQDLMTEGILSRV